MSGNQHGLCVAFAAAAQLLFHPTILQSFHCFMRTFFSSCLLPVSVLLFVSQHTLNSTRLVSCSLVQYGFAGVTTAYATGFHTSKELNQNFLQAAGWVSSYTPFNQTDQGTYTLWDVSREVLNGYLVYCRQLSTHLHFFFMPERDFTFPVDEYCVTNNNNVVRSLVRPLTNEQKAAAADTFYSFTTQSSFNEVYLFLQRCSIFTHGLQCYPQQLFYRGQ